MKIIIQQDKLEIDLALLEKALTLTSSFDIPWSNIAKIDVQPPEAASLWHGLKLAGKMGPGTTNNLISLNPNRGLLLVNSFKKEESYSLISSPRKIQSKSF